MNSQGYWLFMVLEKNDGNKNQRLTVIIHLKEANTRIVFPLHRALEPKEYNIKGFSCFHVSDESSKFKVQLKEDA